MQKGEDNGDDALRSFIVGVEGVLRIRRAVVRRQWREQIDETSGQNKSGLCLLKDEESASSRDWEICCVRSGGESGVVKSPLSVT